MSNPVVPIEPVAGKLLAPCAAAISAPEQLQLVVVLQVALRHLPDTQVSPEEQSLVAVQSPLHCCGVEVVVDVDVEVARV